MSELPKGWEDTTLGEICSKPQYGYTTKADPVLGEVKFLRTTDITKGLLNWDTVPFCMEPPSESSKYQLVEGDIVIARSGSVGVSYLIDKEYEPAVFASYLIRFKPITPILSQYVKAFLDSHLFWEQVEVNKAGNALQNINAQKLSAMSFPLAPLAEQKRIVEKLDEVLAQVDTVKARLDGIPGLLKRFRQSVLASAVSGKLTEEWRGESAYKYEDLEYSFPICWNKTSIADLIDYVTSGSRGWAKYYAGEGSLFIRSQDINTDELFIEDAAYVKLPGKIEGRRTKVELNDILVTITGANVTKCARIKSNLDDAYVSQHVALIRLNDIENAPFVELNLKALNSGRKQLTDMAYGGGKPGLNLQNIKDVKIALPRAEEQKEIVRLVNQYFDFADTIEAQVKKAQARVDNLTQSILAKAFRGELVDQNPNDEPADKLLERIAEARKEAEALAKAAKKADAAKKRAAKSA